MQHSSQSAATKANRVNWLRFRRFFYFCLGGFGLALAVGTFFQSILFAIAFSCALAYLVRTPFTLFCRYVPGPRSLKALIVVILLIIVFILVSSYLIPLVYSQVVEIISRVPRALEYLGSLIEPIKERIVGYGLTDLKTLDDLLGDVNILEPTLAQVEQALRNLMTSTTSIIRVALNLGLVPVFTFFLLAGFPRLWSLMSRIVPPDLHIPMRRLLKRIDHNLMSAIQGQVLVALILMVFYMVGFSLASLRYAIAIGAIAGMCRVVPYLDVIVGSILSLVVIITFQFQGLEQLLGVGLVFVVVQLIDATIITPRIIGDSTGLHPGLVIAGVIACGDWLGFVGVILAVPIMATAKSVVEYVWPYYLKSPYYFGLKYRRMQAEQSSPPSPKG